MIGDPPILPAGLGAWVAFEGWSDPGPKRDDLDRIVDVCRRIDATWIAPRVGQGDTRTHGVRPDPGFDARSLQAYRDAGLYVAIWVFSYPTTYLAEIALFSSWAKTGLVDAVIINAEFSWVGAHGERARDYVRALREAIPDWCPVLHAPPDYLGSAGGEPWDTFDAECDGILPQCYGWEHDDRGQRLHVERTYSRPVKDRTGREIGRVGYEPRGYADKAWPILCTYRPTTRGFVDNDPSKPARPTPPLPNEADRVASDLIATLEHPLVSESRAPSLYTIDALNFVRRSTGDVVLARLERWAESRRSVERIPYVPEYAAHPLGRADRAENEIARATPPETPTSKRRDDEGGGGDAA